MKTLLEFHRRFALAGARTLFERLLFWTLAPLSLLYGGLGRLRNFCYDRGLFRSYRATVPVVSVGNLVAGGTGKTPVADWLVKELHRQGKAPAIISRGYGGRFRGRVGIVCRGQGPILSAAESGDEPFLLARRNPWAIVLIARRRADGAKLAVDLGADVIVLDDGFQHRQLVRDLDLVLLDAALPLGNGWPLPAGLLREFPGALSRADLLLLTRAKAGANIFSFSQPVYRSYHRPMDVVADLRGRSYSVASLRKMKLLAFTGIADPAAFFASLEASGLVLTKTLALSDHCSYDDRIKNKIITAAAGCDAMITTEKDGVKIDAGTFALPCYQMPMVIDIDDRDDFIQDIEKRLWSHQ